MRALIICWIVAVFSLASLSEDPDLDLDSSRDSRRYFIESINLVNPVVRKEVLDSIAEYALNRTFLYELKERELYQKGYSLDKSEPGSYLAAFNKQQPKAKTLAKFGYAALQASSMLTQRFSLTRSQTLSLPTLNMHETPLYDGCPVRHTRQIKCGTTSVLYRTADGSCNNLKHPEWGRAMRPYLRYLPPHYRDGVETIRRSVTGKPLPSPRLVSRLVHVDRSRPSNIHTMMLMQWGQFLDHDLTATAQSRGFNGSVPRCCSREGSVIQNEIKHPECLPIIIPGGDTVFNGPEHCMEFVRSSPCPLEGCVLGPREQLNQITSFLDASNVYGSSLREQKRLRKYNSGLLKYTSLGYRKPLLPPLGDLHPEECQRSSNNLHCFIAGDIRVNEQPGLASMHTLWMREHNRIASKLAAMNKNWSGERVYQESRKIVVALMQHITYNEWLFEILGPTVMRVFGLSLEDDGKFYYRYNQSVNPSVANSFGAAAFRFGHSLVQSKLERCDKRFRVLPFGVDLHKELMNPSNLHNFGAVDRLVLGLAAQKAQARDEFVTKELSNHLFKTPERDYGLDLVSINIQRGRDHGLPPYNYWRERCSLRRLRNFGELLKIMGDDTVGRLRIAYEHIDDVDLFSAGLAERPVYGGLVGPTFACIIAQQFNALRKGDRFWYENGGMTTSFTEDQLREIKKVTLARIICDNLDDVDKIQPYVMRQSNSINPRVSCNDQLIPEMNLTMWHEYPDIQARVPSVSIQAEESKVYEQTALPDTLFEQDSPKVAPESGLTEVPQPFDVLGTTYSPKHKNTLRPKDAEIYLKKIYYNGA